MSNWIQKKTGEVFEAIHWYGDYQDPEVTEFLGEDTLLTLAIVDAQPGDWLIKQPDHVIALTPRAFHEAYEQQLNDELK